MYLSDLIKTAKQAQSPGEPLRVSFVSGTIDGLSIETIGASSPRINRGEDIVFTMKVHAKREKVTSRLTQEILDEMTSQIHQRLSGSFSELVKGTV